ncbi:hypothetical protein IH981_04470 [Patescibacteria group bacterium]|nr:hypothetical protein [Patescibacteria group bacterium]
MRYRPWKKATEVLSKAKVVIISPEDVGGNERNIQKITLDVPYTVVTLAEKGSRLHQKSSEGEHFPTRPAKVVDPTGAGDVFAAAFFIRLFETGDPRWSCQFANIAASLSVEGQGIERIPVREQIESILSKSR